MAKKIGHKEVGRRKAGTETQVRIVGIRVDEAGHRELRVLAAQLGVSMQSLGIEALNLLLKEYGRAAEVRNPLLDHSSTRD
jgi:hypothetical protein